MLVIFFYGFTALNIVLTTLPWSLIPIAIFLVVKNKPRKKSSKRTPYKKKTNNKHSGPKRSHGENKMYEIVRAKYPNEQVLRNERPNWLKNESGNNLELDVFFPELNLAFEYPGRQHREHVPFFGTVDDFKRQKKNDEIKRTKCKLRGISLIEIWFDDPLNKTFINRKIKESKNQPVTSSPSNKSNVTVLKKSTPVNVTEADGNLPCLTCGFSKCNMEYHYGA